MKHNLKQALATAALLLCSMVAMAQTTATVDGITYEFITKAKLATVVKSESGSYSGNIVIPEIVGYNGVAYSVTAIGENAFYKCFSLTSVTIPKSVTTIGNNAFYDSYYITAVYITDLSAWCNIDIYNVYANPLRYGDLYINGNLVTDLVIPNDITEIKKYAFNHCTGLTSITIPGSVTTIGLVAFQDCTGLTSVTIPNSVTTIGGGAFDGCTSLTSVTIPNSVTTIEGTAFSGCTDLTNVTIGNSVTTIGNNAFSGCTGLTSVTIPNSVTTIGRSAFYGCTGFTNVTIGNSVTTIGEYAFYGCSNLETVKIGKGIKYIKEAAFANCENLTDVYCYATSVPNAKTSMVGVPHAFGNSYIEYATLHVPEESIDSYKSTEPWSSFGTKTPFEGELPDGPQTPVTPKCATPVITYSAGKLNIACDTEGAQFVTTITDSDIRTHYDSTIELTVTYNITTYATLAGYENSDTIQASLCWIDSTPTMEQIGTDISEIASTPVLVRSSNGNIFVSGATEGTAIRIYSADGMNVGSAVSSEGDTAIPTTLQKGKIAIVAIGNSRIKMVVR